MNMNLWNIIILKPDPKCYHELLFVIKTTVCHPERKKTCLGNEIGAFHFLKKIIIKLKNRKKGGGGGGGGRGGQYGHNQDRLIIKPFRNTCEHNSQSVRMSSD